MANLSSEKVFYGGNTQFSWEVCRWIEHQSKLIGRHIHHTLCGHGGERCVVIDMQEILVDGMTLELQLIINSMDASGMAVLACEPPMTGFIKQ